MDEPFDRWKFLADIANSPRVSKSWNYSESRAKECYAYMFDFYRSEYCPARASNAIEFASVFMQQFFSLSPKDQKAILKILRTTKDF